MPFMRVYMAKTDNDTGLEKSLREITAAGEEILENVLTRMIRIGVYESDPINVYEGGEPVEEDVVTVIFNVGPGRSLEAKNTFMKKIAEVFSTNMGFQKENVRCHILDNWEGHHLVIDGAPKDFTKKVK